MSSAASSRSRALRWLELPSAVVLAAVAVAAVGLTPAVAPLVYLAAVTPRLCSVDAVERRLPNRLVLPGYLVAAAGVVGEWIVSGSVPVLALVSGASYFVFMLAFGVTGGMGMGDVKLAGVLGLASGLVGMTTSVLSPLVAFLLGGVAAVVALGHGRGTSIPFGPFLLAGFWVAVVFA